MRLSSDLIMEFQDSYFKAFGEHIAPEAAEMELLGLSELIRITHPAIDNGTNNGEEYEAKSKSYTFPSGAA